MNILEISSLAISIIALAMGIWALVSGSGIAKIKKEFFAGKNAGSLEDFIIKQNQKLNELTGQVDFLEAALRDLQEKQKEALQNFAVVRYNPFKDNGGNLSFSLALLDGNDKGLVITSMHGREQNRVYTKPIADGESEFTLTEEELQAIELSKRGGKHAPQK